MSLSLRDAASGALVTLPREGVAEVTLGLGPAPAEPGLAAYRQETLVGLLGAVLERWGARLTPVAEGADAADVSLWSPEGAARDARVCLLVAPVLLDGRLLGPEDRDWAVEALRARGVRPGALRYLALTARYGEPWNVTATALANAAAALAALADQVRRLPAVEVSAGWLSEPARALRVAFDAALAEDLDTPTALAALWQVARADLADDERGRLLLDFDRVLALGLAAAAAPPEAALPDEALALIEERAVARRQRDWDRSDELREQLAAMGVEARDTPDGSTYQRRARRE